MANTMQSGKNRWRPSGRQIGIGIIVLAALIFILQNSADTSFQFLSFHFTMPLWLATGVLFVLGLVIGLAISGYRGRRQKP